MLFHVDQSSPNDHTAVQFLNNNARALYSVVWREIVTESFEVIDINTVTIVLIFRSESKGSGFHDERL